MINSSEDGTSLKAMFQGLIPDQIGLLQGTVKSIAPLSIQIENDDKLLIGENITYVPRHLTNYETVVDIVQETNPINIRKAKMTVYNALKIGDTVHLLSLNLGKQYYILDKVV